MELDPHPFWSAKMTHKSEEISSCEVLDVLFGGIRTSPVEKSEMRFLIKKYKQIFLL
jgi:hypothetical protein